ncbi:hypothetical protein HHI36_017904 [Cryptolaemus montrouzieri]|uniref:Saccharopine dehydrogenase NADP binding domain-containing protein n=1 Tax=Cryptolaemus montrouzieri TaxID=559131 RepID=A0ABD2NPR7_9CUCU
MVKKFDIILFGVTGLVGRYSLRLLHKLATAKGRNLTWAVAGRDEIKIRNVLEDLQKRTGDASLAEVTMILADMENAESIENMVQKARIIANACGPLRKKGEVVIKACLKYKTHYVDVSAEPNFIEKMELKYNDEARTCGLCIVSSCGVDSIAYDMGLTYLQRKFEGTLNSVEIYFRHGTDDPSIPGPDFNRSTWKSAIDLMAHSQELNRIRKKKNDKLPSLKPKLPYKLLPFKPELEEGWAVPLMTADLSVIRRTQQYMYKERNARPIQVETYLSLGDAWEIFFVVVLAAFFAILTKFELGRKILLKYTDFFSLGVFGDVEPSEEKLEMGWFRMTLHGKGWKGKPLNSQETETNKELIVQVKGRNQGYGATGLCMILAAIVLITEPEKLPKRGGVFTPGAAFCDTTLIEQLNENGINFETVKEMKI